MHILIAPNAFKNSLDAGKVAEAIGKGLEQSKLDCTIDYFPVADGGDGTGALLIEHLGGKRIQAGVHDPVGRKINSSFGLVEKTNTAIIELADASGLRLLSPNEYDPLHATTFGTGELIKEALNLDVQEIILCIGGSATVDGGTGILRALGIRFLNEKGSGLDGLPASLLSLSGINTTEIDQRIQKVKVTILCDVENLLLGREGAPAVFGPQKGASPDGVKILESCLTRFRDVALRQTGTDMATLKHGGAAGGVSAGLHVFANARLVNGIDHFLNITEFSRKMEKADLIITGEGSLDGQTLHGKGPFGVARMAKEHLIPVIGMAGKVTADKRLLEYFDQLISINKGDEVLEVAIKNTRINLEKTARSLGDRLCKS